MTGPGIKQVPAQKLKLKHKLIGKIKVAEMLALPEHEYSRTIKEIEDNELFRKYAYPQEERFKLFGYSCFRGTAFSGKILEINEEVLPGGAGSQTNIEAVLKGKEKTLKLIKKIGEDKFLKYFLRNEGNNSVNDIAGECGITIKETENVIGLLNDIDILNSFNMPQPVQTVSGALEKRHEKIARITVNRGRPGRAEEAFNLEFSSINATRGKYVINYDKLENLKRDGVIPAGEIREIKKLINKLEKVNIRKNVIYNIVKKITEKQAQYLRSGRTTMLLPFTEKQLAAELNVDRSIVCRAIAFRSIETPSGEEKPLRFFLPNIKYLIKEIIFDIIYDETIPYTDKEISKKLKIEHGLEISRRSIACYRSEMKLKSNFRRKL